MKCNPLGCLLDMALSTLSSQAPLQLLTLKVMYWNVDASPAINRFVLGGGDLSKSYLKGFTDYLLRARWPGLLKTILAKNPTIVGLCEIMACDLQTIMSDLKQHYLFVDCMSYAPNQVPDNSFYYVTASKYLPIETKRFWATSQPLTPQTPDTRITDATIQEFRALTKSDMCEKGMFVNIFEIDGQLVLHGTIHLGLVKSYQVYCMQAFSRFIMECQAQHPGIKIILGGDFNTFPRPGQRYDTEVLAPAVETGLTVVTPTTSTFGVWPFDFGIERAHTKDQVAEVKARCAEMTDPIAIRKTCAELIVSIYGVASEMDPRLLQSTLDHVITNVTGLRLTSEDKAISNEEFIAKAVAQPQGSDHAWVYVEMDL